MYMYTYIVLVRVPVHVVHTRVRTRGALWHAHGYVVLIGAHVMANEHIDEDTRRHDMLDD